MSDGAPNPVATAKKAETSDASDAAGDSILRGLTEVLFVLLPIFVLGIILYYQNLAQAIWSAREWSFASAVLFGQGIISIIESMAEEGGYHRVRIVFVCAIVLVIGLVPSLVILALIVLSDKPPIWLTNLQMGCFVFSVICYFFCRAISDAKKQ